MVWRGLPSRKMASTPACCPPVLRQRQEIGDVVGQQGTPLLLCQGEDACVGHAIAAEFRHAENVVSSVPQSVEQASSLAVLVHQQLHADDFSSAAPSASRRWRSSSASAWISA